MNGVAPTSAPNMLPPTLNLVPLPSPWTEHVAPTGHYYYYNPITSESTYIRPISLTNLLSNSLSGVSATKKKKKKEKPLRKQAVPDTPWLRVVTNRGNIFYANKDTKESTWDVPQGIEEALAAMALDESDEQEANEQEEEEKKAISSPSGTKRKLEENEASLEERRKRMKLDDSTAPKPTTISMEEVQDEDEDEEAWQRRIAEEMAEEAEMEDIKEEPKPEPTPSISPEEARELFMITLRECDINPMHPWELSLPKFESHSNYATVKSSLPVSTQKEIFDQYCKDLVQERRQNIASTSQATPLQAYQSLLREKVLSTRMTYNEFRNQVKKERKFYSYGRDEKERERVFRSYLKELGEKKKNERKKAEEAFLIMLKEGDKKGLIVGKQGDGLKWTDVKRAFQKDPRYDAVGSSSLREELFETFVKSRETSLPQAEQSNPDTQADTTEDDKAQQEDAEEKKRRRERAVRERMEKVRREQAELEQKNARSRAGLNLGEAELAFRTLLIDNVRDPNISFQSALSYLSADPRFSAVTQATAMSQSRLQAIFNEHISHIQSKGSSALYTLFESYAPGLNIRWDDLSQGTKNSLSSSGVAKQMRIDAKVSLGSPRRRDRRSSTGKRDQDLSDTDEEKDTEKFEYPALRQEFERWQRQRFADARAAFDVMLSENAFVEFWGRVRKMGVTDDTEKQRLEKLVFSDEGPSGAAAVPTEEDPGEGEGGGGRADLQSLAKAVDVKEVERVLKGDKRYIVFDYMPEQRHQWVTDYLQNLSAPKASVHLG